MEINTKFRVDEEAFTLHSNKIIKVCIKVVHVKAFINNRFGTDPIVKIEYSVQKENALFMDVFESELFKTKEELLKSL